MLTQINTSSGRFYKVNENLYPSVTTVLDATKSPESRDRLRKWQHKMDKIHGTGGGESQSSAARDRGIKIHEAIAFTLSSTEPMVTPELLPYWESAKPIVKAIRNPTHCEHSVYHGEFKYAGTLDLIAQWQGKTTIIDWKTSYRTKRLDWITDHTLQIAAYAKAYEWMYGVSVEQSLIVIITPERSQLFQFDHTEINQHWQQWKSRLSQYYSLI